MENQSNEDGIVRFNSAEVCGTEVVTKKIAWISNVAPHYKLQKTWWRKFKVWYFKRNKHSFKISMDNGTFVTIATNSKESTTKRREYLIKLMNKPWKNYNNTRPNENQTS